MADLIVQLHNYRLTTAEILYRLPDYPSVLQTFIWQDYDVAPRFPVLGRFIKFWERELDGELYGVKFAHSDVITPGAWRGVGQEFLLH